MENSKRLPVIRLELNSGVFRIKTEDAVYEITVQPQSSISRVVDDVVQEEKRTTDVLKKRQVEEQTLPEAEKTPATEPAEKPKKKPEEKAPVQAVEDDFFAEAPSDARAHEQAIYREITEDMFNEIGKLARQLSLSIKGLPEAFDNKMDIEQAGLDIENAKGMLENVVKMTEKATMEIMDISENINENCEEIKQNLDQIKQLHFVENDEAEQPEAGDNVSASLVEQLLDNQARLKELIRQPASEKQTTQQPAPAEPQTVSKTVYSFDIDTVFQTLYELCTNEAVKKNHITPMREDIPSQFDVDGIQQAFSDLAPEIESEDGFFNFPISSILKILFQFSNNEKNKQVLKKMNQSSADIFLDQVLPIEGKEEQIAQTVAPEEPAAEPADEATGIGETEADAIIEANLSSLRQLAEHIKQGTGVAPSAPGYSMVKKEDHQALIGAIESTDSVIQNIIENIKRILETLTFQDLSGQKILKIVDTLSFVQVQLLGILVSFGAKLKKIQQQEEDMSWDETEDVEDEFNKLIGAGKEEAGEKAAPLDQGAVDKLLAELGF